MSEPTPSRGHGYSIDIERRRWWWLARVVTITVMNPESPPTFRSRSRSKAIAKAKLWCDRDQRRRTECAERIEYLRDGPPKIGTERL